MISISSIEMEEIKDKLKAIELMNKVHDAQRCTSWQSYTDVYFTEEEYDLVKKYFLMQTWHVSQ